MNRIAILSGIAVAVIASGVLGAYAILESDIDIPTPQNAEEIVSEINEGIDNADLGYGQVEKQDGAYSP
ncbi:MAG: hypothetical protein COW27_02380 [Nitrosopumilales archaeon CG15_BIG_FIL_POST_REV_8_21_14_020_37_12]|nr:MAG: hypothetical protein COW27_02380 [Nitrosopumilales archaeon CG15_BIG_FIL_POST_REV_8_21_14_020_37_12]